MKLAQSRPLSVPGSDIQNRALGIGDPLSADRAVGKQNARWSEPVDLTGGGAVAGTVREYDVEHDLGETPSACTLVTYENPNVAGTFIEASEVRRENWSHSHCHVSIRLTAGSLDGCVARFLVRGK